MSRDDYIMREPSRTDPLLEQMATPQMMLDHGFIKLLSARFAAPDTAIYARRELSSGVMHYVCTYGHIVITIASKIEVAEYAARSFNRKGKGRNAEK